MVNILVVDDEAHATRLLKMRLEGVGYRVDIATDGREAIERVEGKNYDVVITDICMPRMSGRELCEAIRKRSLGGDPALIVATSRPDAEHRRWTAELSDAVLFEKPLSIQRLIRHLGERFGGDPQQAG